MYSELSEAIVKAVRRTVNPLSFLRKGCASQIRIVHDRLITVLARLGHGTYKQDPVYTCFLKILVHTDTLVSTNYTGLNALGTACISLTKKHDSGNGWH